MLRSCFQVAEITRPLMSVSRICDQDLTCIFDKKEANIVDEVRRYALSNAEEDYT